MGPRKQQNGVASALVRHRDAANQRRAIVVAHYRQPKFSQLGNAPASLDGVLRHEPEATRRDARRSTRRADLWLALTSGYGQRMWRWLLVGVVIAACGGGGLQGGDGEACYPNSTCNAGFVCTTNECTAAAPGVKGGPCYPNETCNAGLVCQTNVCDALGVDAGGVDGHMGVDAGSAGPGDFDICLNGSSGEGTSIALSPLATLTTATIEFWYRSADPTTPASGDYSLVEFHPTASVGGNYPDVSLDITNAFAPLTGRVLLVSIDARGGPQNELDQTEYEFASNLPDFDEKGWNHYAVVFSSGSPQRVFVDGTELTTSAVSPGDGTQATTFASAFGSSFTGTFGPLYMSLGYFARDGIRFMRGGLSDLRVSDIARYTTNFVPPWRASRDANAVLLLPMAEDTGATSSDVGGSAYNVTWTGGFSWSELLLPCP